MPTDQNEALDRATEAARKVLQRAKWYVRKDDEVAMRQLRRAVEAAVSELALIAEAECGGSGVAPLPFQTEDLDWGFGA